MGFRRPHVQAYLITSGPIMWAILMNEEIHEEGTNILKEII